MNSKRRASAGMSVADYITQQIAISGQSQKHIADILEYDKPNIITMFKQGKTKVPLNKIPQFARALGVDPVHFLRIAMTEYAPLTWRAIEQLLGKSLVSQNEMKILNIIRDTAQGVDVAPEDDDDKLELMTLIAKWRERDNARAEAALSE